MLTGRMESVGVDGFLGVAAADAIVGIADRLSSSFFSSGKAAFDEPVVKPSCAVLVLALPSFAVSSFAFASAGGTSVAILELLYLRPAIRYKQRKQQAIVSNITESVGVASNAVA
jgi:hypothetical protein